MTTQPSFFETHNYEHGQRLTLLEHQTMGLTKAQVAAFWRHVLCGLTPDDCWLWTGELNNNRYGVHRIFWNGRANRKSRRFMAHRLAFVLSGNSLDPAAELDHLCRNRICVNPRHLEAVSHRINILRGNTPMAANARKTHCPRGHAYTFRKNGRRHCLECNRVQRRALYAAAHAV